MHADLCMIYCTIKYTKICTIQINSAITPIHYVLYLLTKKYMLHLKLKTKLKRIFEECKFNNQCLQTNQTRAHGHAFTVSSEKSKSMHDSFF